MSARSLIKRAILGPPGPRARTISRGLLRGLRFEVDSANKSMRLLGLDEREIAGEIRRLAHRARSALDIGANDGWYALYFAAITNVQQVYAFEPTASLQNKMKENFALNDPAWLSKTEFVAKFVGNRDGAEDANGAGGAQWCSIDALRAQLLPPVLLKIDVDGGEVDVLVGARRTLEEMECLLLIETHSVELERSCISMLESLGYRTHVIDNAWYRRFLPEHRTGADGRPLAHNRWLTAERGGSP